MSSVLVVGAHPDDEAIGCGGTLRRHVLDGDVVRAIFLTSGEAGGHGIDGAGETREREARQAAEILGISEVEFWHEPDGRLRARGALVERLAAAMRRSRASILYAPHRHDDHPDHRCAARVVRQAVAAANRRVRVLHFEIWAPLAQNQPLSIQERHSSSTRAALTRASKRSSASARASAHWRG